MMQQRLLAVGALLAAAGLPARAQDAQCSGGATQDACQKAVDLFAYMAPQLGAVIAGGNPTLGQGGTLGGPGHFAVSVRVNAVEGSLPQVDQVTPSLGGRRRDTYETRDQILPLPAVDAAVGIFKGVPLGLTNVGGVDLLVTASYLPEYTGEGLEVATPEGSFRVGYGARVGLLQESFAVPGVGVSYVRRRLPTVDVTAATDNGSLDVRSLSAETESWRVTASKNFLLFGLAVGGGQDMYDASASVRGQVASIFSESVEMRQELTRTNYFANLSFTLLALKAVAEIGQVSGGEIATFNEFSGKEADASRFYGSVGLRFGF
jgi:hypothetical protein